MYVHVCTTLLIVVIVLQYTYVWYPYMVNFFDNLLCAFAM